MARNYAILIISDIITSVPNGGGTGAFVQKKYKWRYTLEDKLIKEVLSMLNVVRTEDKMFRTNIIEPQC